MKNIKNYNEYKINNTYLYHSTTINNLISILKTNRINTNGSYENVSFSRNKNFWYRSDNRKIRLVLDRNKLSTNYKITPFDFYHDKEYGYHKELGLSKNNPKRKVSFEYEEYVNRDILYLKKYLIEIQLSEEYKNFNELNELLIKYTNNTDIKIVYVNKYDLENFKVSIIENLNHRSDFKIYNGDLVLINNVHRNDNDEVLVEYTKEDGSDHNYYSDYKEYLDDFIDTDEKFILEPIKKEKEIKEPKKDEFYNLVFYIGNKKVETIKYNITSKLAYPLKNKLSKEPKYNRGIIKVEKI